MPICILISESINNSAKRFLRDREINYKLDDKLIMDCDDDDNDDDDDVFSMDKYKLSLLSAPYII